jgi:uncharacterized protein
VKQAAEQLNRQKEFIMVSNFTSLKRIGLGALASASMVASAGAAATEFEKRAVSFQVEGQTLRGNLYLPAAASADRKVPAVVVGGSLTSVKEQMSASYAEELAKRGIAALAFDYRHYGQSDGQPRQLENVVTKKNDLKAAVSFLQTVPSIQAKGISLLGVCTSGGNVLQAAAEDNRIRSVVTVAGWFVEPSFVPMLYGGEAAVTTLKAQGNQALAKYRASGVSETVQTYGLAGSGAAHAGDHMDYYVNKQRGNVPQWTNAIAVQSWESWLSFDPVASASKVKVPTMIIHSDDSALPDQARKVYGLLAGKKELNWLKGGHFEFYDNATKVQEAAGHVARFVREQSQGTQRSSAK